MSLRIRHFDILTNTVNIDTISDMLRISRRADYAVRVMIAVARANEGEYVPASLIGETMMIPPAFLVKVIGDLRRGGLIMTAAGRNGGISLAGPVEAVNLRQIVEATEGPIVLNTCLLRPGECPMDEICPAHMVWERIQAVLCAELEAVSLESLARRGYRPRAAADESQATG